MPKIAPEITDLAVRQLKPKSQRYDKRFRKGLEVRVFPGGSKVFQFIYQSPLTGKRRRMTLGTYHTKGRGGLTVSEASDAADQARKQVSAGVDPQHQRDIEAEKRALDHAERQRQPTVESLASDFFELKRDVKPQTLIGYESILRNHVFPRWEHRRAQDIQPRDVRILVMELTKEGKEKRAGAVIRALQSLFSWGVDVGFLEYNPALGVKKPIKSASRERVLDEEEIALFWRRLSPDFVPVTEREAVPLEDQTKDALLAMLVTPQRLSEVTGARWPEFDFKQGVWTIPKERTKNKKEHRVPITPLFKEILVRRELANQETRRLFESRFGRPLPDSDLVFPSRTLGKADQPMSNSIAGRIRRWEISTTLDWPFRKPRWTPHDLRRTVRTQLGKLNVPDEIAERVINHRPSDLRKVYNTHEYDREISDALMKWERRLREIVGLPQLERKVIPMPGSQQV